MRLTQAASYINYGHSVYILLYKRYNHVNNVRANK